MTRNPDAVTAKGECLTSVRHDGVLYKPGDLIEVPSAAMDRLVEAGAVEILFEVSPERIGKNKAKPGTGGRE